MSCINTNKFHMPLKSLTKVISWNIICVLKQFDLFRPNIHIMTRNFDWYSKTDCVEYNTDYYGSKIYNIGDKFANSEKLCQKACQEHPECNWWSLNSIDGKDYGCWLKTEKNSEKKEKILGRSFGPKFCGMYWVYTVLHDSWIVLNYSFGTLFYFSFEFRWINNVNKHKNYFNGRYCF